MGDAGAAVPNVIKTFLFSCAERVKIQWYSSGIQAIAIPLQMGFERRVVVLALMLQTNLFCHKHDIT